MPSAQTRPRALVTHDLWKGFWRLADPKISLASMASIFLGACAAAADGSLHVGWLIVAVLGIFAIEVAKNASAKFSISIPARTSPLRRKIAVPFRAANVSSWTACSRAAKPRGNNPETCAGADEVGQRRNG